MRKQAVSWLVVLASLGMATWGSILATEQWFTPRSVPEIDLHVLLGVAMMVSAGFVIAAVILVNAPPEPGR